MISSAPFLQSPPGASTPAPTREKVADVVAASDLHKEVEKLRERVDLCTRTHDEDLGREKAVEAELEGARPGLEGRGARLQRWQKVRRLLPKVGFGATLVTLPCMSLGASLASPVLLGVALVGALTIGGSIFGIEKLKSWLPDRIDRYNGEVERFNRRSRELDGLREESRRSRLTLDAAVRQYEEKSRLERSLVDETSLMVDAAAGRVDPGRPSIEERPEEVAIGSIRLPRLEYRD